MLTYLALNLVVMAVLADIMLTKRMKLAKKPTLYTLATLLMLTLVCNSLIIYFNIVAYNPLLTLPFRIGIIPPEDFAYACVAAIFLPFLWRVYKPKRKKT